MNDALAQALGWAAQAQAPQQDMKPLILMFVAIGLLFYFMIIRPQKTEQKKRAQMLDELAKGDKVVTTGGIHATVESVNSEKQTVVLTVAPKLTMTFARAAVQVVTQKKGKKDAEDGEKK